MKYSRVLVALSAAACSYAQEGDYASGLLEALQSLDLTALLDVLPSADPSLISALREGEHTVFAPSNAAFDAAGDTFPDITNLLQYHVTAGAIDDSELTRDDMVYRTLLSDSPAVMLPGNQAQVVSVYKLEDETIQIDNIAGNATVTGNATYENLHVWIIDSVLRIPDDLSTVLEETEEVSALASAIQAVAPGLIEAATEQRGLTFFAPINSAITDVARELEEADEATIRNILLNHILNGTVVYSPSLTDGAEYTSAAGESLTVTSNRTGTWVTSGPSSAMIMESNVLTSNGVIHLIDSVLLNPESDPGAASTAFQSATSVAEMQTESQTEPVSTPSAGMGGPDIATPMKIVVGLVFGTLLGAAVL